MRLDRGVLRSPRSGALLLVVGVVLLLAGVAFHGVAAAHRPSGPDGGDTWTVLLNHAGLRAGAYGRRRRGGVLAVRGWSLRRCRD